jgi:hypothetical protein
LTVIESLSPHDRLAYCKKNGIPWDDLNALPATQRLRYLTRRALLAAYVCTLIAVLLLVGIIVYKATP